MRTPFRVVVSILSVLVVAGVLGGCSSRSGDVSSPVNAPQSFSDTGTETVPDRWWRAFGDTELNRYVDRALDDNFDLRTAWSRLRAARAVLERESASYYPNLDGSAGGQVTRNNPGDNEQLSLGLTAEYEVDLWGRIDSAVEAEEYRTRATLAEYRTAGISLSAEVARTWFRLVEQRRQLDLLNDQIETNRQVLQLIVRQYGNGQVRRADILRQEQLLESTREQKIAAESNLEVLKHQFATLLGRTPDEGVHVESARLPELPSVPETGLPTELVRRRPDVRSAYNQLRAADREVAVAVTDQYPRLSLTASLTSTDEDAADLFDDWARSFAAELTAPLLDAGQRDAEVDRTEAVRRQRLYEYGQAVLTAFREVEDALVEEQKLIERIQKIEDQLKLSEDTVERLRTQYLNGTVNYIDVLNALNEEQQLRRDRLTARLNLIETRVALYRALAGGFSMGEPGSEQPRRETR